MTIELEAPLVAKGWKIVLDAIELEGLSCELLTANELLMVCDSLAEGVIVID